MPLRPVLLVLLATASGALARETTNLNREWKFQPGDHPGAEATSYDAAKWSDIHLPHSFSIPYFMGTGFYTGYGWYRRSLEVPAAWKGKRIALEFEAAFQDAEVFVNGTRVTRHRGGYVGFPVEITGHVKPGKNLIAVRLNNLWQADLAPRAGDHTFSGGLYRDVRLVVTDPLHVTWCGTFVTTPTLAPKAGAESAVRIQTEVRNASAETAEATVRTDIVDPAGNTVATISTKLPVPVGETVTFDQTTPAVAKPQLWSPENPRLYRAVTTVSNKGGVADTCATTFGFRWFEWTSDRGFFLNGKHVWLSGANVHQDHAGWGDAVTNAAHERDVRMVKEAGFNFIRGSHYPKDPAFGDACDRLGVLWLSENVFWGIGGAHQDGGWSASAYPVTPEDEAGFEESVLDSLRAMIRIHRNHPSIVAWSTSNEPFFSDCPMPKVRGLLEQSVALAHELDPTRPAAIGGAQRPLDASRIDRLGDIAAYNGDGASQPAFQNPAVPSIVSEYGSVITDRPGAFDPGWGDLKGQLKDGRPARLPWRAGEAVWCMYDHGSHAGENLARMGIVDYFRVPKRAFFWYRENYSGVPAPAWPVEGKPARLSLTADKTTLAVPDGTDDAQLQVHLLDASGRLVNAAVPVTLAIEAGPGDFPTGRAITFSPPGHGDASDIAIRDGQAAIAFRSYHAGETVIRASSPGLPDATVKLRTLGSPAYMPGVTRDAAPRPYARFRNDAPAKTGPAADVLALHRPTSATSSATGSPSSLANDAHPATAWRAADDARGTVSWQVFLEVAYDVQRIGLVFPDEANHRYAIEVSSGGETWQRVVDQSDTVSTDRRRLATGEFGRGIDYVRVRFQATEQGPVPALAELEVGGPGTAKAPAGKLGGTVIGTAGSYGDNPAVTRAAAFDGRFDTFFDAPATDGAWAGLDLGRDHSKRVTAIAYAPRSGGKFPERMKGGRFQGANKPDFGDAVDLFTVTEAPEAGVFTKVNVSTPGRFRYLRYLSPDGGSANVAEIAFLGQP